MHEVLLEFKGRLTLANAQQELALKEQALRAITTNVRQCEVVADLSALVEVDTSALAVILHLDRAARALTSHSLTIRGASEDLRSLARLSSLESVLNWQ